MLFSKVRVRVIELVYESVICFEVAYGLGQCDFGW